MTVFDLDELALKNRRLTALTSLRYRKSDRLQWPLRFLQNESFVELPADAALSVAVKRTRSSSSYLALASSSAKTGTGSNAIYTFDLNLNTEPVSYELSDKERIDCVLEVEVVTSTQRLTSQSVPLTIERDIIANDPPPVALPDLKATKDEAESGANNAKWMTPLRVAQAITARLAASASVAWSAITGKPASFPPEPHTHDGVDIRTSAVLADNHVFYPTQVVLNGRPVYKSDGTLGMLFEGGAWHMFSGSAPLVSNAIESSDPDNAEFPWLAAWSFDVTRATADDLTRLLSDQVIFRGDKTAIVSSITSADIGAAAAVGSSDIEITDPERGIIRRSPNGTRWREMVNNDGTTSRVALAIAAFFSLAAPLAAQSAVRDLATTNGTLVGTNLRINTATNFAFGGVGGVLEVEALDNHAIAAKASDITDGAAFYGRSESGAPVAKLVQSNHFNSPALTVWRTPGGDDTLSPAVLIAGNPASATNKALSIRNGGTETFWVKYDGTTSITNTGTAPALVAWAGGLTNSSYNERLVFDGMAGRLHFYASQTTDPDFGVVSSQGYMIIGTRGTNGFLQAKGDVRIEKQGGGLAGLQIASLVTGTGQTNSLPAVNATLVPWMGSLAANPGSAVEGAMYFNTTDSTVRVYAGGSWRPLN